MESGRDANHLLGFGLDSSAHLRVHHRSRSAPRCCKMAPQNVSKTGDHFGNHCLLIVTSRGTTGHALSIPPIQEETLPAAPADPEYLTRAIDLRIPCAQPHAANMGGSRQENGHSPGTPLLSSADSALRRRIPAIIERGEFGSQPASVANTAIGGKLGQGLFRYSGFHLPRFTISPFLATPIRHFFSLPER